jgi:hypothetical protein
MNQASVPMGRGGTPAARVKRRKILALLLLPLLGLPCIFFYLASGPADRANQANFEKLQIGMTLDQVEALLGTPDVANFDDELVEPPRMIRHAAGGLIGYTDDPESDHWIPRSAIVIRIANDRVTEKKFWKPTWRVLWLRSLEHIKAALGQ